MANESGKGPELEYIVSGIFQGQGYLTRRSVPIHYGHNSQDATDIDVVGFLFTQPFQIHKIICDCKNKQKSKPYERIFWAKGLSQFVDASEVYVTLPKASWDTVKFAQKGNVRIFTSDLIKEHFLSTTNLWGQADYKYYAEFFGSLNEKIKSDKAIESSWNSLRKLYLNEDPYVSLNITMELLLIAGKKLSFSKDKYNNDIFLFWKYICCELIVLIGLNILKICADTICLPDMARKEHIYSKLTYGDIEPNKINNILDYAKNMANEIIKAAIPKNSLPEKSLVDFGEISPPTYAPSIVGLVERALQNPDWYINLPQILDFILFEFAVKNNDFSLDKFNSIFYSNITDEKLKAAKNILIFARNVCKIDMKLLWDKSDTLLSKEKINENENVLKNEI